MEQLGLPAGFGTSKVCMLALADLLLLDAHSADTVSNFIACCTLDYLHCWQ